MGSQRHEQEGLPPGKIRYPLYRRLGRPQDRSTQEREISLPTGIWSPDRPAGSESLYRLSYRDPVGTEEKSEKLRLESPVYWLGFEAEVEK